MHRFFTSDIQQNYAIIRGDDVKHIAKVLRLKTGDVVQLCDGQGKECEAKIKSVSPDAVLTEPLEWTDCESEPAVFVSLFQCLPKAGKMETIIQKCVELGVNSVVPVQSERCVVVLKQPFVGRVERWQRVSEEAAKQSRRGRIPIVSEPCKLHDLTFDGYDIVLAAYENERKVSVKTALLNAKLIQRVAIVIGPEGGFAEQEIELLQKKGAVCVSLGPRILRTETAGMAMLAQIMYEVEL